MKRKPLSSVSLDRCAYAAGYAAVSAWHDEIPPRALKRRASGSASFWRLALMLVFVVA